MKISWYPGHMHKARKELQKLMDSVHVVIEVLDARIPAASANPVLATLRADKPCITILNKADLAVADATERWRLHFASKPGVSCLVSSLEQPLGLDLVLAAAERLLAAQDTPPPARKLMVIVGIPNVGKSTLLNHLCQRKLAKTGNEPAVTKAQQRVRLEGGWYLVDTPGLLWPRLDDQQAAARLASTGTIRNTAIAAEDVAWFTAEILLADYRPALEARYGLDSTVFGPQELLDFIGRHRGTRRRGGTPDLHNAAELLLNDFRSGKLGRFSLELPPG